MANHTSPVKSAATGRLFYRSANRTHDPRRFNHVDEHELNDHRHPVSPSAYHYHGTTAPAPKTVRPGMGATAHLELARHRAAGGAAHADTVPGNDPRIMLLRIELPEGAPVMPATDETRLAIFELEQDAALHSPTGADRERMVQEQRRIWSEYHSEGITLARELGLRAFYDDMHWGDSTAELTIVDPSIVTVVSERMLHEPPATT